MMISTIGKQTPFSLKESHSEPCRLKEVSLKVIRPPASIARYRMLQHTKRVPSVWNKRYASLSDAHSRLDIAFLPGLS